MNIKWSKHVTTAVDPAGYPESTLPEIAMVGRSNVGKSSVINLLTNRKKLARIGNTPGKTRQINFFSLEDRLYLVDLPGYGYAKASKAEQKKWGKIVETYLNQREQLQLVLMLVDIRHKPTTDDRLMYEWICAMRKPHILLATKSDKISKAHHRKHLNEIMNTLEIMPDIPIIPVSVTQRTGCDAVWNCIQKHLPGVFSEELDKAPD